MRGVRVERVQTFPDTRGVLEKLCPEPVLGEVYLVRVAPGASRGHHLHRRMGEWFTAISGRGVLGLLAPETGERRYLPLHGARVYVPPGVAHALFAEEGEAWVVLACAEAGHDPADVERVDVPAPGGEPW
jgi:oxalate decarboxylase/phosphoglucose isomerase-like protein (cupin superfamily)